MRSWMLAARLVSVVGLVACSPVASPSSEPLAPQDAPPPAAPPPTATAPTATPTATTLAPATPAPALSAGLSPPVPIANDDFHFSRVHESCNSFSAHITNPSRDAWLDLYVDVERLGLGPGTHEIPVDGDTVRLTIRELAAPHDGEWSCTDVGGGPLSKVTRHWKAREGTLRLHLHLPAPGTPDPPYDGPYDRVDIVLKNVRFVDASGETRSVTVPFDGLRIGWMPG